jgi:hypothetical protein
MRKFFGPQISNNLKAMGLVFYCKDCEKIVDVIPVGRKFVYKCAICKTKNVAFGTDKSIRNFFRLPEEDKTAAAAAKSEPAVKAEPAKPAESPKPTESVKQAESANPETLPEQKKTETAPTPIPENK